MTTIYDPRYLEIIERLKNARIEKKITQQALAKVIGEAQSYVSKVEGAEQRLDIIELYDWLVALNIKPKEFLSGIGWFAEDRPDRQSALPLPGRVEEAKNGINMMLTWQGQEKKIFIENVSVKEYLVVENEISTIFGDLNKPSSTLKNREAICFALISAFRQLPGANPSDVYHQIVYRLYLREYTRTQPEQSWVRAGGEALELFVERHYAPLLLPQNIVIKALIGRTEKANALAEMGLAGVVGDSKLDVCLYGLIDEQKYVFGGIHCKASFAERVSDDVPCSEAMMRNNLASFLFTFDAKSFPPPLGDLINRGELGTLDKPSDKRKYIEDHGSFDACFCYNLRSTPSAEKTKSGKRIYVSSFQDGQDLLPTKIIEAWSNFKAINELGESTS